MTTIALWIWAITSTVWAVIATAMLIRNPLPFPDRGHRSYALPSEETRQVVLKVLRHIGGLKERFTFDAGPTHQTLMWDGYTVLNYVDQDHPDVGRLPGNAISLPVKDPRLAAQNTMKLLSESGYTTAIEEIADYELPPNYLVVVESDAFKEWVLVFRRHIIKMPRPKLRSRNKT